jgi:hypothetical protein
VEFVVEIGDYRGRGPESGTEPAPRSSARFAPDSALEEAVWSEPVSEAIPASREFTGNFIESGLRGASTVGKKVIESEPYEPITYASEQGIF